MMGELTREQMEETLSNEYIVRIGFQDKNRMYILPVTYCYDKNSSSLIGLSGPGTKINVMRNNPDVCFEIEHIESILNWKSVMGWGKFEELKEADARNAIHLLVNKVRSLVKDENNPHMKFLHDLSNSRSSNNDFVIYRIKISESIGKLENK